MTQKSKVLIIDDHPLICNSYKRALKQVMKNDREISLQIEQASDCDQARELIQDA